MKTYLLETTGDSRTNHLVILYARKDKTDAINLVDVAYIFVGEKASRKQFFGKFSTMSQLKCPFYLVNTRMLIKQDILKRSSSVRGG